MKSAAFAVGCLLLCATPALSAPPKSSLQPSPDLIVGTSSWYGAWHHGKRQANGKPFDMNAITVAHRTLPLGSQVLVTNLANGRSVCADVTDRGPYIAGRILDASRAVARQLDFERAGLARVAIMPGTCRK